MNQDTQGPDQELVRGSLPRPRRTTLLRTGLWPFDALSLLSREDHRKVLQFSAVALVPLLIYILMGDLVSASRRSALLACYFLCLWAYVFFRLVPARAIRWITSAMCALGVALVLLGREVHANAFLGPLGIGLLAIYFSCFWAILFLQVLGVPEVRIPTVIFCFWGTGFVSIALLLFLYQVPGLEAALEWTVSGDAGWRWVGHTFAVAFPEELCKILMLYVISRRPGKIPPVTMAYYGMICGLGFGIYEGLEYQLHRNRLLADSSVEFWFLNLLRVTSMPVLHAVWTGTAGFFLGLAFYFGRHIPLLCAIGLAVASLLHGLFNTYGDTLASLGLALLSVLILNLYLAKIDQFQQLLGNGRESALHGLESSGSTGICSGPDNLLPHGGKRNETGRNETRSGG